MFRLRPLHPPRSPSTQSTTTTQSFRSGDEPAAEVAATVGRSVVLIKTNVGSGSGIVYDKSGVIFTNAHVVEGATKVDVTFSNGRTDKDATVIASDESRDIAVLRVPQRPDLVPIVFGRTGDLRVGQIAIAIGAPFGLDQSVTQGIVERVGPPRAELRQLQHRHDPDRRSDQPGQLGWCARRCNGRLIGMNTSIRTGTGSSASGSVGVGFAVPADTIKPIVERMLSGQVIPVSYLGVSQANTENPPNGVLLGTVAANSPAGQSGLLAGDIVTAVNGAKVTSFAEIRAKSKWAAPAMCSRSTTSVAVRRPLQR